MWTLQQRSSALNCSCRITACVHAGTKCSSVRRAVSCHALWQPSRAAHISILAMLTRCSAAKLYTLCGEMKCTRHLNTRAGSPEAGLRSCTSAAVRLHPPRISVQQCTAEGLTRPGQRGRCPALYPELPQRLRQCCTRGQAARAVTVPAQPGHLPLNAPPLPPVRPTLTTLEQRRSKRNSTVIGKPLCKPTCEAAPRACSRHATCPAA